jgi:hypothetical protein
MGPPVVQVFNKDKASKPKDYNSSEQRSQSILFDRSLCARFSGEEIESQSLKGKIFKI